MIVCMAPERGKDDRRPAPPGVAAAGVEPVVILVEQGERAMSKKRKPHEQRTPEEYMEAADNSLELAKVLAGQGGISDHDFLERMARSDELVDHDGKTCGQCHYSTLGHTRAR